MGASQSRTSTDEEGRHGERDNNDVAEWTTFVLWQRAGTSAGNA